MKKFIINDNDAGQRVDKFLSKALPFLPKSMMYKLLRKKDIKLNGKRCEISTILSVGDTVTVYADEKFCRSEKDYQFKKAKPELNVVYEDENIIIVNKPNELAVHCDNDHDYDTLINRIKHYLFKKGNFNPDVESSFTPALCSRLDKNTCGLVTAAKTAVALREVNKAIREDRVTKIYHCVAIGSPPKNADIITAYHFKKPEGNIVKISATPREGYKEIKTGYKVLRRSPALSLLEITLYTGRTHQIRAHLAHIKTPVLGDGKYGNIAENKKYNIFMQALCAYSLAFEFDEDSSLNYLNGKTFCAPAPDFEKIVR